ncbi:arylsulfatase [Cyclobacterium sp.]|uniref:sulfatase family protein n=1 Tax=Cyclobacterium sp. TaxID=1966343 RepID=UPI0019BA9552|nr:arylsulfatase [Cyclobacterium sp.]MBD3628216.1 arylsulfatase [Cyclobacterium sp.]
MFRQILSLTFMVLLLYSCVEKPVTGPPNVVIIYADDMGYGDLNIQNPDSKIPTPQLDKLASEGMRFTDAHSSSGICSPSRYALLTGTYHWRRKHGIVGAFGKPFFDESDITLPQVMQENGYATACIGKWHLGWNWEFKNPPSGEVMQWGRKTNFYLPDEIDWTKPVSGGPLDRGFDYYYGDGTINFPPYAWVENDRLVEAPTEIMDINDIGFEVKEGNWEFRPGPKVKGWNPYEVLPTITEKATEWIGQRTNEKPFFLYFSLPSPHAPIIPNDEFDGKSKAGAYGDFVNQTDWVIGQVLKAIEENGFEENTIVIFTSDNGPERYAFERGEKYGHFSMGQLRGLKRDVWEGGHRVPFIIKWPGHIPPGSRSEKLVSQIDIMSTLADLTETALTEGTAPDSYHFLPELSGTPERFPQREFLIHNTMENRWAVRQGDWVYINDSTGQHTNMPDSFFQLRGYHDFDSPGLLFNLNEDSGQRINHYASYPEKIESMERLISESKAKGYLVKKD